VRVLIVHNAYQRAGGEDAVVDAEKTLLLRAGNQVSDYLRDNNEIAASRLHSNIALGVRTVWSSESKNDLFRLLQEWKPDVVHFHNTFPLISPAAYYACRELGLPVIQTLHNYRLFCPSGSFFRDGKVCEECLDGSPWQAIRHACYRQSRAATVAVAAMISFHHGLGTWMKMVDRYIALSEFSRAKFISAGLPAAKIVVKPNFVVDDPGVGPQHRDYAVFIGRLSQEKGIDTLVRAWTRVNPGYVLRVVGDGPLFNALQSEIDGSGVSNVHLLGQLSRAQSMQVLQGAKFLVLPSNCYENFPMVLAEAYACGTPVIASRMGAMQEIVKNRHIGLNFNPGDEVDLAEKVEWAWTHPEDVLRMGANARIEFEAKYTAEKNYTQLMAIYESVIREIAVAHKATA
jgi:glycosyltransferase involved in cell wall biosynthesis